MRFLSVLLLIASCAACGPPPLTNTHGSADALARAVLDALARNDDARLRALALDEAEFRDHIWPQLPAARPERNLPLSYVWGDLHQKSDNRLRLTLAEHRGKRYELQRVRFDGETTAYAGFNVHRQAVFVVRDSSGAEQDLRVAGSLVEMDGVWKVFSFVVDD